MLRVDIGDRPFSSELGPCVVAAVVPISAVAGGCRKPEIKLR
jgi:hypothetical protein